MKHIRRLIRILLLIIAVLAAFAAVSFFMLRQFYNTSEQAFIYPGIDERAYDMQGLTYDSESGYLFFSGYMRNKESCPVYIVDKDSGETIKKVSLLNEDGSPFTGHAGGLSVNGSYFYLAGSSDDCLYIFSKDEILDSENGGSVKCIGIFPCSLSDEDGVKVSFIGSGDGMLYVGEFHMPLLPMFRLRSNHVIDVNGSKTAAVMAGFRFDEDGTYGLEEKPCVVYRLPDYVQGAVVSDNGIYLSRSFFFVPSGISLYSAEPCGTYTLMNAEVPLYTLKEEKSIAAIPMTEEIELVDGKLYIASELINTLFSGFGKLWGAEWCRTLTDF